MSLFDFSEIFTILLGNINYSNSTKKSKNIFLDKNFKQEGHDGPVTLT